VCENKCFMAAGILCPSELGTLGLRRSGKLDKQCNYVTVRRKCILTVCQIDTYSPCRDQRRSVGVKVCSNRHRMSKRTGETGVGKIRKRKKKKSSMQELMLLHT